MVGWSLKMQKWTWVLINFLLCTCFCLLCRSRIRRDGITEVATPPPASNKTTTKEENFNFKKTLNSIKNAVFVNLPPYSIQNSCKSNKLQISQSELLPDPIISKLSENFYFFCYLNLVVFNFPQYLS